jgi:integrase
MRDLLVAATCTGMRETAILHIDGEDLTLRPGRLRAWDEKRRGEREEYFIPIAAPLAEVFRRRASVKGPVFRWPDGRPVRWFPKASWHRLLQATDFMQSTERPAKLRAAGTPGPLPRPRVKRTPLLRFHDLRHLVGVTLAEAGFSTDVIRAFLHHATREASEIYTRWISDHALDQAATALGRRLHAVPKRAAGGRRATH